MKITAIEAQNFRGFKSIPRTEFSERINVFIGANNAGKSSIINSIFHLQRRNINGSDLTIGQNSGMITLYFNGEFRPYIIRDNSVNSIIIDLGNNQTLFGTTNGTLLNIGSIIPEQEPNNLIYPYLSKRKTVEYNEIINENSALAVTGNFQNLYSKVDRLTTPEFQPGNNQFVKACMNILGFRVSTLAKRAGKHAVYFVHNLDHIPLTSMGEGVANVLGLVTDLCIAEDKIFLIEEPENDIHPKALKALLNLIIEKSDTNQFFISTHSNIVMKYLGSESSTKLFHVESKLGLDNTRPNLFVSSLNEVPNNAEERRIVLEELGYDFYDFDLWKAWLFLEESSAERIIKNYLINWFVKPLSTKVRTFSSGGVSKIIPKFEDFNRLFVFLHLEPTYKNRVWVIIDKGDEENQILAKLKEKYKSSGWDETNFLQFSEHDFEKYYPECFQKKVSSVLQIVEKKDKIEAKKELLNEVINWINNDEELAKEEFEKSAKEVIEILNTINEKLNLKN